MLEEKEPLPPPSCLNLLEFPNILSRIPIKYSIAKNLPRNQPPPFSPVCPVTSILVTFLTGCEGKDDGF